METFPIAPASARPMWFLVFFCIVLAVVVMALVYTAYSSRNSRVEIGADGIRLVGDFWGREIPYGLLDISAAHAVDLTTRSEYSPVRRTLGTGLPGYASGWFRLRNGEKALLYLTERREVVYLPTTDGYSLLLSVADPARFLESLRERS
jgi:hypothetical protein